MDHFSDKTIKPGINTVDSMITHDFPKVSGDMQISRVYEEFGYYLEYVYVLNSDGLLIGFLDKQTMIKVGTYKINKLARELVCKVPMCLTSSSSIEEAVSLFSRLKVNEVPVVDKKGRMIGVLNLWSVLNHRANKLEMLYQELDEINKLIVTLETVIENPYEGMIAVDENCRVVMINNFYLEILGVSRGQALGRHIYELTPHSKLPEIIRTGKVQFAEYWKVLDRDSMIFRAPIKKDGKIIGAFGKTLFKDMGLAHVFTRKLGRLENDLKFYKEEFRKIHCITYTFDDIIGESFKIKAAIGVARRAARTASTVLLKGESGTGKELFAHAIHNDSLRKHGPFIKINCAAIPEQLLESELFGYAEGAFTGACKGGKPGKFELANLGTIFLDEIGDMSLTMQAKILRVIQELEIERVGGTQPCKIDVRIIAATNCSLDTMVKEGTFRDDLYYRLNVMVLELPSLRERPSDIELLANFMITKLNQKLEKDVKGISREAIQLLQNYAWLGNVRELESVLERTMNMIDELIILPKHLPVQISSNVGVLENQCREQSSLEEGLYYTEKDLLIDALRRSKGKKAQAAKILGIHRSVLYKKLAKHGLNGETLSRVL